MTEQKFENSEQLPKYSVVVLVGPEQSGKTTLATAYANSKTPPAKVIDGQAMHRRHMAELYGCEEKEFKFPRNNNVAHVNDDEDKITFAEAFDNAYAAIRSSINWDIFVNVTQMEIIRELSKPDGARCFVVDDISYADECKNLMDFCNGDSVTMYLEGNPGHSKGMNTERMTTGPIEFISECTGRVIGIHKLLTDKQEKEKKEDVLARCIKQINVALRVTNAQREAKKKKEAEEAAKKAAEANNNDDDGDL